MSRHRVSEVEPRSVLVVSQRKVARTPANATLYEFEDLIGEWESADLYEVDTYHGNSNFDIRRKVYQGLRLASSPAQPAIRFANLGARQYQLDRPYDVAVFTTSTAFDLFTIGQLVEVRKLAKQVVAYVAESWPGSTSTKKLCLEPWDLVDHIFVGVPSAAEELSAILRRVVVPMPAGVDTDLFATQQPDPRPISISNPGRRAPAQHKLLSRICDEENLWYYYDTISGEMSVPARYHRSSYAETLKHSKAVVCNPARFDEPARTRGTQVVPYRVFEALAAGCRIFGSGFTDGSFRNAGLPVLDIAELPLRPTYEQVHRLLMSGDHEAEPKRYQEIARRHSDWAHRWNAMLAELGLRPSPQLAKRLSRLSADNKMQST